MNMSKKYLPNMSCGYNSPKHTLHHGCGKEFMKKHEGEFDVIITDSSDPIGIGFNFIALSIVFKLMKRKY